MKRFILILALLCLPAYAEQVCSVHDGDTLRLCSGERIRLWGIDAPELKQPMGEASRDYLRALVKDREVDLACKGKSYNRRVCCVKVRVDGRSLDLQRELVGHGLAFDDKRYSGGAYMEAEAFARKMNRGTWRLPGGGVRPWVWRKR